MESIYPSATLSSDAHSSGASWPAIFAGALATAAFSLILLTLGTGLKLASVSPWASGTASHSTIKASTIVWLLLMQVIACGLGGYLAGRLRTRWARIHGDEVFFRDTAHGFLSWALATVVTAAFLASAAATMAGQAARVAPSLAPADSSAQNADAYYVDALFRWEHPVTPEYDAAVKAEASRILLNLVLRNDAPETDRVYLAQLVAARTGISPSDANQRITDATERLRTTLETARVAGMKFSLWMFIALLLGAFTSSAAATVGGRQRDLVIVI